jgi:dTMP kinase
MQHSGARVPETRIGRFLTLEGLDGAGKSTHLSWLAGVVEAQGISVCMTREPGGTPLGETLRRLLLDPAQKLHAETETLLMFAARREHLHKVIVPALEAGHWVLCDRFTDATFAYQGGGSSVRWEKIAQLETWTQAGLQPDLTLYFDVEPGEARSRASAIKAPDRYEQEREDFHRGVRAAYLRRAAEHPERVRVIDAMRAVHEIQTELEVMLASYCQNWVSSRSRDLGIKH